MAWVLGEDWALVGGEDRALVGEHMHLLLLLLLLLERELSLGLRWGDLLLWRALELTLDQTLVLPRGLVGVLSRELGGALGVEAVQELLLADARLHLPPDLLPPQDLLPQTLLFLDLHPVLPRLLVFLGVLRHMTPCVLRHTWTMLHAMILLDTQRHCYTCQDTAGHTKTLQHMPRYCLKQ